MKSRGFAWSVNGRTRRGITLSWLVLFVVSILLQYGTLASPKTALANAVGNQTLGGFELDGNLFSGNAAPGSANGDDWAQGATGNGLLTSPTITDPVGNADTTNFGGGSKENAAPSTWHGATGVASPKDDLGNVYIGSQLQPLPPGANSHLWTFIGVERASNNGTTFFDFEFNQKPNVTSPNGISVPNRTAGDILLVAQQQGNGSFLISATIQTWTGSAWSAPIAPPPGAFYGLSNDAAIPVGPWADDVASGGSIPIRQFAEMAFDLTAFGVVLTCPSQGFGEVNVRTRSSISASSEIKDYASAPVRIPPNCASLSWQKQDGSGHALGGATFTVTPNPFTGTGAGVDFTDYVSANPQADPTKDQDGRAGYFKLIDVVPGTYTVTEKTAPPGYIKDTSTQHVTLTIFQDGTLALPFINPRKTATTTLVASNNNLASGSFVAVGQSITLTATESNTGQSTLHNISVIGTNSCPTWTPAATKNGGGTYSGTLLSGESANHTCTFNAPNVGAFNWSATATGLDEVGDPASSVGETINGNFDVLQPATKLTIVQNAPAQVHATDTVTIIVNEKNDGEGTITGVHVDGTGACAWVADANKQGGGAFSNSLAPNESVNFTCTVVHPASDFAWTADGKGTDALDHAVPITNEHQAGSVGVVSPSTLLTIKSAPAKVHAGDTITIVVTETNTGNGPLTNVHVVAGGACTSFTPANVATLASGTAQDFTCTITTIAGDGTDKTWTADGVGTDSLGALAPTTGEHQGGTVIVIAPATTLTPGQNTTKVEHGTQVTLTVVETNTGDDALAAVHVTGTNSCADWTAAANKNNNQGAFSGSLAPGQSVNFTCTFTVGTADVAWTALGHGVDSLGADVPATNEDEAGNINVINPATVLTFVSSIPNPVAAHGSTTITVRETNTGDSNLTSVNVTGSPCATWTPVDGGFNGNLAPTAHEDFSCTIADVGTTNVNWSALGHGTDELQNAASAANEDQSGNVHVVNPNIDIVKTAGASLGSQAADGTTYQTEDGTSVVYKYVVTTQDPDGLTNVSVSDDKCSPVAAVTSGAFNVGDTNSDNKLEPGESWVFSCSMILSIANQQTSLVHNIATATGTPLVGNDVSSQDDANVALLTPGIQIVKTAGNAADGATYVTEAFTNNVAYHYSITNTGEIDLLGVTVVDDNGTPANTADDITVCTISTLAVGATTTCDITLTVTKDTTNVVVASGHTSQKPGSAVSADDDAVVDVVGPAIQIIKTAGSAPNGAELVTQPGPVTYHYAVTNTGEVNLVGVHVVDDNGTPANTSDDIAVCTIPSLAIGQTVNCSVTLTVLVSTTNIAVATGHTEQQPDKNVSDQDNAVVRTPNLDIAKSYTGNTGGSVKGTGIANIGDTLTYTLAYTLADGPVTNGVITDVLPDGLGYVDGSATNNTEFTFVNYVSGTRTLKWTAANVTKAGSVTYQVKVLVGSSTLPQPLENVATIASDQTPSKSDAADVLVQLVESATDVPTVTLPPTDTLGSDQAPSNPGFGLMLTLFVLAGIGSAAGYLTPMRRRTRRERIRRQ